VEVTTTTTAFDGDNVGDAVEVLAVVLFDVAGDGRGEVLEAMQPAVSMAVHTNSIKNPVTKCFFIPNTSITDG